MLYLGGQDDATIELIAKKANRTPDKIQNMELTEAYLFIRGSKPKKVERYDVSDHPEYEEALALKEGVEEEVI